MKQLIVYTCITNGKDSPKPMKQYDGLRYVCFTDGTVRENDSWEYQPLQWNDSEDPRRIARWHKVNSHLLFPDSVNTLWIDGNITLNIDPRLLQYDKNKTSPLVTKTHPSRDCVYQEFEAVRRLRYDDLEVLARQEALYRKEGLPEWLGLPETNIVYREPCDEITRFNTLWWDMISGYSKRDQLSFTYVTWKLGLKWDKLPTRVVNVNPHSKVTSSKQ